MSTISYPAYTLELPAGWTDSTTVIVKGPARGSYQANITITRSTVEGSPSSQAYGIAQRKGLEESLAELGYEVLHESETALGGEKAFQRVQVFRVPGRDFQVQQLQYYQVCGNEVVTITCTDHRASFQDSLSLFLAAVQKFRWTKMQLKDSPSN